MVLSKYHKPSKSQCIAFSSSFFLPPVSPCKPMSQAIHLPTQAKQLPKLPPKINKIFQSDTKKV